MVPALEIASEQNVALRLKLLRIRRYFCRCRLPADENRRPLRLTECFGILFRVSQRPQKDKRGSRARQRC